jgi:hypothetical protein
LKSQRPSAAKPQQNRRVGGVSIFALLVKRWWARRASPTGAFCCHEEKIGTMKGMKSMKGEPAAAQNVRKMCRSSEIVIKKAQRREEWSRTPFDERHDCFLILCSLCVGGFIASFRLVSNLVKDDG